MKGVIRFKKKGKLSLRYISPFKILSQVGHVLLLWHYIMDEPNMIFFDSLELSPNLAYKVVLVPILNGQVLNLRTEYISSMKVQ